MKTKDAVKFGFGFALGTYLFAFTKAVIDFATEKYISKRFDEDGNFRERVKSISPELYAKHRKDNTETDLA